MRTSTGKTPTSSAHRRTPQLVVALVMVLAGLLGASMQANAATSPVARRDTGNPLAGSPWGVFDAPDSEIYDAYRAASGGEKDLLGKIALQPRVKWFGQWIPTRQIAGKISHYIAVTQHGDPNTMVQLALFRLWPHTEAARRRPLSRREQADYRAWIREAARGIGSSKVALILEPDLAVALKAARPKIRLGLARYAAQTVSRLPGTTAYLDAGDADWLRVGQAEWMLKTAGVAYLRGFSLGATHYASTDSELPYARALSSALAASGITGKHAVVDTADNGKPFTYKQYFAKHPHGNFNNAQTCQSAAETLCDTLGIPPTTATADPSTVDAYLWFGRPWLTNQAAPFNRARALSVASTTPY